MGNIIIPKRSSVAGKAPATTDLQVGEIAVNLADGLIYSKNASGAVISLGGGGGLPAQSGNAGKYLSTDGSVASWAPVTKADVGLGNVDNTADSAKSVASAATLTTARTINGTSFNGSANITTANWGTARTLTIGSTGKSVNGSGNVSWSLDEIGAYSKSYIDALETRIAALENIITNGTVRYDGKLAI